MVADGGDRSRLVSTPRPGRAVALAAALALAPALVGAQGIRIRGVTTTRFLELQRFELDSVPFGTTREYAGTFRQSADGFVVECDASDAWCRYRRSGAMAYTVPVWQDLQATAWGLGEGIVLHADVRVRGAGGNAPGLWPRATDRFDVLNGYVELTRPRWTARLGRQFTGNGLGVYNYDGASLAAYPRRWVQGEAWLGRSLLRGVNGGYTATDFAKVEDLPPDREASILGAAVRLAPSREVSLRVMYQREARWNGGWRSSGLYSNRLAADGTWRAAFGTVDGSYEYDFAARRVNEGRLRVRSPLPLGFETSVEGHRFRPFFELWTIWGAFAPAGYDEVRADGGWATADRRLSFDVFGGWRKWEDTFVGLAFQPLRGTGWRAGGDVTARPAARWVTTAHYDADIGPGASRTEADLGLRYEASDRFFLGLIASQMTSFFEFRIGTGDMRGGGVDLGWRLSPAVRLTGDFLVYRQRPGTGTPFTNWSQRRASVRLEWAIGDDPGLRAGAKGAP